MANKIKVSWVENFPQAFLRETVSLLEFIAFFGTMVAMWHFGAAQSVWLWMAVGAPLLIIGVFISALVRTRLRSGLVDHSQKMTVAARVMAEKKAVGQRS